MKVLAERFAQDGTCCERASSARRSPRPGSPGTTTSSRSSTSTEHDGRPIIVMEYLAGGSLEKRIDGKHAVRRRAQVLDWLDDAAAALDAAHEAGIVHRDVKPGEPPARRPRATCRSRTSGSRAPRASTRSRRRARCSARPATSRPSRRGASGRRAASDRYALAVVAWELLTGRRPFAVRDADGRGGRARQRAGPVGARREPGAARVARRDLRARAREGSGCALPAPRSSSSASCAARMHDDGGRHRLDRAAAAPPRPHARTSPRCAATAAAGSSRCSCSRCSRAVSSRRCSRRTRRSRRRSEAAHDRQHGHQPGPDRAPDGDRSAADRSDDDRGDDRCDARPPQRPVAAAARR